MSRYCERCGKAVKACICQWVEQVDAKTELWILQHPTEVKQPLGTARILTLALPNARLWVGENFSHDETLNALLSDPNRRVAVLYPGEQASPLSQSASEQSHHPITTLILLDGTWKKAYKMWQLSENLHALPCVRLEDTDPGNYRIRKSPKATGLSTVEAAYHALTQLEGDQTDFQPLLVPFNRMIDFQISQMPPGVYERHYGRKSTPES
ncbi:tRNA-uridine aminocarboxypropyltransferase [Photobacterium sp. 1_MG-2023]|uniref:tRNA-uridine aminocarboxypropyltransferase n=1 Tax=Photobacterium sp. 1_MG-2023 TaxID=3062646 RepID=UPI0026E3A1CE|nr:tRNA-uridine aminocarboxypropyltransferase [Photobacterium sp. 1_MG-2023]MDO6707129.1 tRNA-uridine aminocarboxypropyltransferase [Photobacterium sp. 1_MG-2023]